MQHFPHIVCVVFFFVSTDSSGSRRTIPFATIRSAELIDLKFGTGKYRLVGISPGRLRTFFHWDSSRASKPVAISLDTGARLRRAISPEDPERVLELIEASLAE